MMRWFRRKTPDSPQVCFERKFHDLLEWAFQNGLRTKRAHLTLRQYTALKQVAQIPDWPKDVNKVVVYDSDFGLVTLYTEDQT